MLYGADHDGIVSLHGGMSYLAFTACGHSINFISRRNFTPSTSASCFLSEEDYLRKPCRWVFIKIYEFAILNVAKFVMPFYMGVIDQ